MIKPEYSEGHDFASTEQLERLHKAARDWLCSYGSRQFLASSVIMIATLPVEQLEQQAQSAVELLNICGDMTVRYTVPRTEQLPAGRFGAIHHADQTDFMYPVAVSMPDEPVFTQAENIYIGTGHRGMFGVREKVYGPDFAHLAGSLSAPRAMDFVDGSIIDGRMTDVPERFEDDDFWQQEAITKDGHVSLSGVKRCLRRVRDMALAWHEPEIDDEYREMTGPAPDELFLTFEYDSIRITVDEALALETLVRTSARRQRQGRRLVI